MEKIIVGKTILKSQIENIAGKITFAKFGESRNLLKKEINSFLKEMEISQLKKFYGCSTKGAELLADNLTTNRKSCIFVEKEDSQDFEMRTNAFSFLKVAEEPDELSGVHYVTVRVNQSQQKKLLEFEQSIKESKQFQKDLEVILASYKSSAKLLESFPELGQYIQVQVSSGALVPMSVIQNVKEKLK